MQKAHLYEAILLVNRGIDEAVRGLERLKRAKDSGLKRLRKKSVLRAIPFSECSFFRLCRRLFCSLADRFGAFVLLLRHYSLGPTPLELASPGVSNCRP
jgi:hypothetical protein